MRKASELREELARIYRFNPPEDNQCNACSPGALESRVKRFNLKGLCLNCLTLLQKSIYSSILGWDNDVIEKIASKRPRKKHASRTPAPSYRKRYRKTPAPTRVGNEYDIKVAERACEGTGIHVYYHNGSFVFYDSSDRKICSDQKWKYGFERAKRQLGI